MTALRASVAVAVILFVAAVAVPFAHHGWGSYNERQPLTVEGTIGAVQYMNPHGMIKLETPGKVWDVVLAPVSRMQTRGLTQEMLKPGTKALVVGYAHREVATEMRAENVTIGGKKVELR